MDSLVQLTLVRRLFGTLNLNFPLEFSCFIDVAADDPGLRLNMAISVAKVSILLPWPRGPRPSEATTPATPNTQPRLACHYVPDGFHVHNPTGPMTSPKPGDLVRN